MDPWYYNRLSNASASFQSGGGANASEYHQQLAAGHQSGGNTGATAASTSQLLLQAAHNTSLTPSPFNTPGFLTSNPYDFPLFHASKNSPYAAVTQHRALASAMASSKSSESEISSLRENYSPAHHPSLSSTSSSYFDHQSPTPSTIGWSHQTGAQLPSPFGILPHESVGTQSSGSSKSASSDYTFNAYQATHNISHLSQLADYKNSSAYAEAKTAYPDSKSSTSYPEAKNSNSYADAKKGSRSHSPASSSRTPVSSSATASFYSGSMAAGIASNYGSSESSSRTGYSTSSKFGSTNPVHQQQPSCIVTSPSVTPSSKDYRMHQSSSRAASSSIFQDTPGGREKQTSSRSPNFVPPSTKSSQPLHSVQTKAQSKVYPDLTSESSRRSTTPLDASQSSPISLSNDTVASLRYASVHSEVTSQSKQAQHLTGNQAQSYQHALNQQVAAYRLYANSSGMAESEYLRSKSSAVDSTYNSSSQQNGSECVSAPRRTSPHVSHSQQSPLGHVPSPAYPMYNSPMASMSSPSPLQHSESTNSCHQSSNNSFKATSSSTPLDVSMSRSQGHSGQSSVAYPSVITRALAAPDPVTKPSVYNDSRSYDRGQEATPYSKQCWDSNSERQSSANAIAEQGGSSSHQRKYQPTSNSVPSHTTNSSGITATVSQQQADPRASDRQHPFYDSTAARQVTLQDLSSCRDDPMSIVKNLQNLQQQTCQVQSAGDDSKSGSKTSGVDSTTPNKRRKSADKQGSSADYYHTNRIPPPAHHNIPAQQHQNGSYFSNYLSPPSSSRSYTGSQTPMHHASNSFMANQHQGLYVPPFFSPFSLPGHSATSVTSSSQSSAANYQTHFSDCSTQLASNTQSQTQTHEQQVVDVSKVIVPNVEEELSFLVGPVLMIKTEQERKSMTSSDFQGSYLRFLQGERETSPPPSQRGVRKTAWTKNIKIYQPEAPKPEKSSTVTNGATVVTATTSPTPATATKEKTPAYDPEDDPRYFPLPKTDAQRRSFDTSDSDSDNDTSLKTPKQQSSKAQDRKPVAAVAPRTASKQTAKVSPVASQPGKRGRKKKSEVTSVPRRETSKRKAKEKGSILLNDGDDDFPGGCGDSGDSDSDPAWTPVAFKPKSQNMDSSDEESVKKKCPKKVLKLGGSSRKRPKNAMSESDDEAPSGDEKRKKRGSAPGSKGRRKSFNLLPGLSVKSGENAAPDGDEAEMFPFKVGEFVVMRTDMSEKWPPIWRVDGKTLLQKFEPFVKNGEMLYRNISTYSGWSPLNRHIYRSAQVRFRVNNKTETVVEFLRDEMTEEDESVLETFVKETAQYQENFEVYIQTLISQALDSNFLTEIFQEQDEYFLTNVKIVDEIVDNRRERFLQVVKWRSELEASVATWPCYNVMFELVGDEFQKNCAACDRPSVTARVLLYGQPYNSTTLEGSQPDPKLESEKDFYTCRLCLSRIELYNKVAHQKYLMYIECAKRVNEKRSADLSKDTTVILNELLADEKWLNLLFRNVRLSWAQIDRLEQSGQKK
ncbi:hypothetical protein ONE63_005731 [Megalurothrips usitatus]|uniref:DUF4211 domain-containing protein n=1 Tax=Megalurothrips usitatus TaxID=439358 RepID=A0AAV7XWG9_9NEOP|nr:hypothetical protein ONE63_005731 [Megalurothrips usitatus]